MNRHVWERKASEEHCKAIIFNVYKYFEQQASKSKYRGPSQVTCKTAEATGYHERTVRCIVGEKASLCGAVDEMARAAGHEVVRLPPYHCELNPIELAWSQVKRHIKDNNRLFTLLAVKDLTHKGFQKVDSSLWKKLVEYVRREFEDKYWVDDEPQEEHNYRGVSVWR